MRVKGGIYEHVEVFASNHRARWRINPACWMCTTSGTNSFIECIRDKQTAEGNLQLALDVTLAIYAGYVSAEDRGREVDVPRV